MSVKLLVADDEDTIRRGVVKYLQLHTDRFDKIYEAENGQEAYERFTSSAPGTYEAVLMDLQMPVMDGCTAARMIRASSHPQARTIPIIALTANAFAEDVAKALTSGMNYHIAKPIDFHQLFHALKQFMTTS